jgi:exopolysaccharide biosynthesis polyprenyl glycosylphosphotransferase
MPERCMIVGSGSVARAVARKLAVHPEYGIELVGFIDSRRRTRRRPNLPDLPLLGDVEHFGDLVLEHRVERVVVAFSALSNDEMLGIIRAAKRAQIKITIVPRLFEVIGHSVVVDEVEGMTVLSLRGLSRNRSTLLLKRAIDVIGAVAGLVLTAPLTVAIAAAVKLSSPGPIFYRQRRMGRDREFEMWKFRSMIDGADEMKQSLRHLNEMDGPMFKLARDPRVTRVGRFLRRTSLDELPQLWNVLRGEMSLVGPRPLIPDEDDHVIGWHRTRLELTPGLTGPWQVAGRNAVPFEEMVKMDYLYVAEWSLWNDIRLLLRTMPVVLLGRGS